MCVCFPFKFELAGELLQFYALHCLWCLILRVSLTGLKDAQNAGKISFLDLSVRVFPEEISIWTGKQSKEDLSISKVIISYCVPKPILDEYFMAQ